MILLLVLHHIADVAFQPTWLIASKKYRWWSIYEHSVIWAGVVSAGLWYYGEYTIYKFIFLAAGHFAIDFIKYRYLKNWNWIYLDQFLHYLQICLVL